MNGIKKDYFNGKMINLLGYILSAMFTIIVELIFKSQLSEYRVLIIGYLFLSQAALIGVAGKGGWEKDIKSF